MSGMTERGILETRRATASARTLSSRLIAEVEEIARGLIARRSRRSLRFRTGILLGAAFAREECPFPLRAPAVAADAAGGRHDAMTRNSERDRIGGAGARDR